LEEKAVKKETENSIQQPTSESKPEQQQQQVPIETSKSSSNDVCKANDQEEEECIQFSKTNGQNGLDENTQLDGIVDSLLNDEPMPSAAATSIAETTSLVDNQVPPIGKHQTAFVRVNQMPVENGDNVLRMDLSKEDDLNSDEEDSIGRLLLPPPPPLASHMTNGVSVSKTITKIQQHQHQQMDQDCDPTAQRENMNDDKLLIEKLGIKRDDLLVPRVNITDLNSFVPDLANQKVKILNDKGGIDLSTDATQTITVHNNNKDSTRYKLAILPLNNSNDVLREHQQQQRVNKSQIKYRAAPHNHQFKVINTGDGILHNYIVNNNRHKTSQQQQQDVNNDYELSDSLVNNIKKSSLFNLDIDNRQPKTTTTTTAVVGQHEPVKVFNKTMHNEHTVANNNNSRISQTMPRQLYKLGMESNYRMYTNQYSTNPLTMNKHQHNQERDRKNILARRFIVQQEFNWKGSLYANVDILAKTLANTIASVEGLIPIPFMHHLWPQYRDKWLTRVHGAQTAKDFAICLLALEACIKPFVFVSAWKDSLGYFRLQRETLQEREERKKEETHFLRKRTPFDDTITLVNGSNQVAHFTKGKSLIYFCHYSFDNPPPLSSTNTV
jgi:hypothetical protein